MAIKPTTISSSYRNRKCSLSRADLEDFSLRGHCAKRKILEGYKSGQSVKNTDRSTITLSTELSTDS